MRSRRDKEVSGMPNLKKYAVQLEIHVYNIGTNDIRWCSKLKWASLNSKKAQGTG